MEKAIIRIVLGAILVTRIVPRILPMHIENDYTGASMNVVSSVRSGW
jgi:hypothetical protein